jgi:hypothetical protein
MKNTGELLSKGFRAYVVSLGLFLVELVLISSEHMEADIRHPFLCAASLLAGFMFKDWTEIVDLAGPIFSNTMPYQNVNSRSIQDREGK